MPIRTWPPRVATRGAWLWLALAAACGSSDSDRPKSGEKPAMPAQEEGDAPALNISVAANDAMSPAPLDATPSPDAKQIYYTALGRDENGEPAPSVFSVAASGGEITRLAVGEPLIAPVNISISLDGTRLFIADPAASAVFTLPASGGTPSVLMGTEGYAPRGLTVAKAKDGREYLYFTGRTVETEEAGLFRLEASGGALESVAVGAPFADPAGVAVDSAGVAYVVETSSEAATARVIRVERGTPSTFAEGIGIGFPAGITLTRDDATVLVSGLDPATKRDVVYFVNTSDKQITRLTKTVGQFHEPAGLHRAHDADVFAWADSQANRDGTVYMLTR
jgi:DNA-binding beta-propeller fold protein YncE